MSSLVAKVLPFAAVAIWAFAAGMLGLHLTGWSESLPTLSMPRNIMAHCDPVQGAAMFLLVMGVHGMVCRANDRAYACVPVRQ